VRRALRARLYGARRHQARKRSWPAGDDPSRKCRGRPAKAGRFYLKASPGIGVAGGSLMCGAHRPSAKPVAGGVPDLPSLRSVQAG